MCVNLENRNETSMPVSIINKVFKITRQMMIIERYLFYNTILGFGLRYSIDALWITTDDRLTE